MENTWTDGSQISSTEASHGVDGFHNAYQAPLASLTKALTRLGKLKAIEKQDHQMNLMELRKQLDEIERLSRDAADQASNLAKTTAHHRMADSEADQHEWSQKFKAALSSQWSLEGDFPNFRVFPIDVRVDFGNEQVLVNKRLTRAFHPVAVANLVNQTLDKLHRESFNRDRFLKALVRAFDVLHAESEVHGTPTQAIGLRPIYDLLVVLGGAGSYSLNQFAFDIYRLRKDSEEAIIYDQRRLIFGTSKNRTGLIIPSSGGSPVILGSLEVVPAGSEQ